MSNDGSINLGNANGGGVGTPYTLTGAGEPGNLTVGELTWPLYALEGAAADGLGLPAFTLAAHGTTGVVGAGDLTLPFPTLDAGTAGVALPAFSLAATGFAAPLATGNVTLPVFAVAGGDIALALPPYTLAASALAGAVASGALQLPALALAATGAPTADLTLPDFTLAATGLAGAVGVGDIRLPLALSATAYQDAHGTGAVTLGLYAADGTAFSNVIGAGAVTLNPFTLAADAARGVIGTADLELPLYTLDATGYFSVVGRATIELPAFVIASDEADGAQVALPAAGLRTTVVVNTRLKGVTLYAGLEANSFANFAGVQLAATAAGIVALTGDRDLGAAINARMAGGVSDFGTDTFKQVLSGYVGYRAAGPMDLTLITDEHHEYVYRLEPRQAGDDFHATRVKFGQGVKGRYWQWKLANRDGADFHLDALELNAVPLTRRV